MLFQGIDFYTDIRARLKELCSPLLKCNLDPVDKAMRDDKMTKSSAHNILVKSATRIPKVQKMFQEVFNGKELNKSPSYLDKSPQLSPTCSEVPSPTCEALGYPLTTIVICDVII